MLDIFYVMRIYNCSMRIDGEKLKKARIDKGWDQTTLAYKSGVSVATICRIETGNRTVKKPSTIKKLCRALGVRSAIVIDEEDELVTTA